MGHDAVRADGQEVTGAQRAAGAFSEVGLGDLFDDGLGHGDILHVCCWRAHYSGG